LALDIKMAEVFDKYYSIQIASHSLSQYLKETNVDNESKNAVNVIGSQWMDLVLLPKILENHEYRFELQVNKKRLYPDKRRNGVAYWSINSNCRLKMCKVVFILECMNRPEETDDYMASFFNCVPFIGLLVK
jgi:hypothetical protein